MSKVILAPPSQITCIINGKDFTDHFTSVSVAYSSVNIIGQGVSYITGTLVLKQPLGSAINFDPRFTADFLPNTEILLLDNNERLPICGSLKIINSNYDFKSTLTINVGCILSSNNSRGGNDLGLCIDFGALEPVGDVVVRLLTFSGVPESSIKSLKPLNNYFLAEPLILGGTESLIQIAGQLCEQFGYLLYQDKDGFVVAKNLLVKENYSILATQAESINYTLTNQPEQAIKSLDLTYGSTKVLSELNSTSQSVVSGDIIVEAILETDDETRTTTSTLTESRDIGNGAKTTVRESVETSTFESTNPVVRNGSLISVDECFPKDQARILTKTTVVTSDNTAVLKNWLAYKANASVPSNFSVSGTITAQRKEQTYTYTSNSIIIEETIFEPIAKVVPIIGDRNLQTSNGPIQDRNPEDLVPAEKTIKLYSRSFQNSNNWKLVETLYLNALLVDLSATKERAQVNGANLDTIIDEGTELTQVSQEVSYNVSEPDVETYRTQTETVTETDTIFLGSNLNRGIAQSVNIGNYYKPNVQLIQKIGQRHFNLENSRIFSLNVGLPLPKDSKWSNIVPQAAVKLKERTNIGYACHIDSPGIVISENEIAVSFTALPFGTTLDSSNANRFSDVITPLPNVPVAVLSELYVFDNINYTIQQTFEVTDA